MMDLYDINTGVRTNQIDSHAYRLIVQKNRFKVENLTSLACPCPEPRHLHACWFFYSSAPRRMHTELPQQSKESPPPPTPLQPTSH